MMRIVPALAALAALVPACRADGPAPGRASRPNVLVILCDDLGWGDVSCQGAPRIRTPRIDRLASEGLRFTACYAAAPVCSPSRAGLLTGRVPTRAGIHDWIPASHPMHLRREETTIATILRGAGFDTALAGKWHLRDKLLADGRPQPSDHGFSHWFATQNNAFPSHHNPENFVRNGASAGQLAGFSCDLVAAESVAWLKTGRDREKPFFLFVSFHEPHEPVDAPEAIVARHLDAPARGQALYEACVENLDRAVGTVLDAIDSLRLRNDTFVFFTSDNGPEPAARYEAAWRSHGSAGPYREKKLSVYEGGIRVPGIVRFPGRVAPGATSDEPISGVDLLPTLCEIAGVPPPAGRPLDGASFVPVLRAGDGIARSTPLHWYYFRSTSSAKAALREGRFKVVGHWDGPEMAPARSVQPGDEETIRKTQLVRFELYDLARDPGETRDLSAADPERGASLARRLKSLVAEAIAESPGWDVREERPLD